MKKVAFFLGILIWSLTAIGQKKEGRPILYKKIAIPGALLTQTDGLEYGGDIRLGDLTNNGKADYLVYRGAKGDKNGATKPCFIGAFEVDGKVLWQVGEGGIQPYRPGPVAIHDIDADGQSEVICFFHEETIDSSPFSLEGVRIQIRDGKTGALKKESKSGLLSQYEGQGPNWVHMRILIANLDGRNSHPSNFIVKVGRYILAFNEDLEIIWSYFNPNDKYQNCPAYIPAVGDIDGDGKDEVNGGYYLLDDDGSVMWEQVLGKNMDSVTITEWDGKVRAFGSGYGHILDAKGNIILKLGEDLVPHGQELQVADFSAEHPGNEMIIRYNGHHPQVMMVGNKGGVLSRFDLNESPNNTGMTAVNWLGKDSPALLFNGGVLWQGDGKMFAELPGLPEPVGDKKMGWYHCIPADVCGGESEEVVTYNPWDKYVFIYTSSKQKTLGKHSYKATARQYNVRLMD